MKAFFKKIGISLVSLWDGIRFAVLLWKEADRDGDENGV